VQAVLSQEATRRWLGPSASGGPDERLSALAAAGDDRAFEVLYQRYSTPINRYLRRRLSSIEEAQDVHQRVFLSAYSALRAGVEPMRFKSWLYRIAHNVCVSELRARKPVAVQIDDEPGLASAWADAAPRSREDLRELLDDLGNIPKSQSSALLLREINDLSYAEIAETLHLPIATVRSHIFRARASLHALQAARDVDCAEIRAELARLAGRRGRRTAHVANHLRVCTGCADYRRRLR
jgi:RNA polymerase sigma factor (sigma-70 family)